MKTGPKYVLPTSTTSHYRLTLTAQAFALALHKNSKWAGVAANLRTDGKWDLLIAASSASLLKQLADGNENLSDTVVRILSQPAAKPATPGGQDGT